MKKRFSPFLSLFILYYAQSLIAAEPSPFPASNAPPTSSPGHEVVAQPGTPPPTHMPPAPPDTPPPPQITGEQPPASPPSNGQWVYTQQHGWTWMPYSEKYVYITPGPNPYPYQYVFIGGVWSWIAAPWIWGWGPRPWYGYYGPGHFGWYHNPGFFRPRRGILRGPIRVRRR